LQIHDAIDASEQEVPVVTGKARNIHVLRAVTACCIVVPKMVHRRSVIAARDSDRRHDVSCHVATQ
jgi:hypothetical protein